MDLLLGRFADAHMRVISDDDLAAFETLMDLPDGDLFAYITGLQPVADEQRTPLLDAIIRFHADPDQD